MEHMLEIIGAETSLCNTPSVEWHGSAPQPVNRPLTTIDNSGLKPGHGVQGPALKGI